MKSNQIAGFVWPLGVTGDLSNNLYKAVKVDTNGKLAAIAAATDVVIGIQQTVPPAPAAGNTQPVASIESDGVAIVEVAAAGVTAGSRVTVTATGTIEDVNGSNTVVGVALEDGVEGQLVSVKLMLK